MCVCTCARVRACMHVSRPNNEPYMLVLSLSTGNECGGTNGPLLLGKEKKNHT